MSFRARLAAAAGTLALLAVLLALGQVFSPDRVQARAAGRPLLPGFLPQGVSGFDLSVAGVPRFTLRRTATGWEIPGPAVTHPASADRVTTFLRILAGLTRTSFVTRDMSHVSELGLSPETAKVLILHRAAGPDIALEVGARGPSGDADYVRVRGEPAVYLARGSLSYFLTQEPASWYELHVLPDDVQGTTVSSITVTGSVEAGEPAVRLAGGYTLRRPSAAQPDKWVVGAEGRPADRVIAGAMASSLANLEGIEFGDETSAGRAPAAGGLGITVETVGGKRYALKVLRANEPGRLLVTADWSPWTYVVTDLALRRAVLPESRLLAR
jgi:hypothetical protein